MKRACIGFIRWSGEVTSGDDVPDSVNRIQSLYDGDAEGDGVDSISSVYVPIWRLRLALKQCKYVVEFKLNETR